MGFFKKLFGGRDFNGEMKEADAHFEGGAWAEARLCYERAAESARDGDDGSRAESQMRECLDRLAQARLDEAKELQANGHLDLAEAELMNAIELAASDSIRNEARRRIETLEQQDAVRKQAEIPDEMSDEDRWALLAGNWEEDQLDEYDEYGERFRTAVLAMHDGEGEAALETLEEIADEYEDPAYLWLEIARARSLVEDLAGSEEALRAFLEAMGPDDGGAARMGARANLAALRDRDEDEDGAIAELTKAMEEFPEETMPFLLMGRFLFDKGYFDEAAEVLEAGTQLLDPDRPDWRYLELVGLSLAEAGEPERAAGYLDQVISFFVSLRRHDRPLDYPVNTATTRAAIHENAGELEKAADLYRTLSQGSDAQNHLSYHQETARLLLELGLEEEARRMLTRALALAADDEEALEQIEAQLSELE